MGNAKKPKHYYKETSSASNSLNKKKFGAALNFFLVGVGRWLPEPVLNLQKIGENLSYGYNIIASCQDLVTMF